MTLYEIIKAHELSLEDLNSLSLLLYYFYSTDKKYFYQLLFQFSLNFMPAS